LNVVVCYACLVWPNTKWKKEEKKIGGEEKNVSNKNDTYTQN
jgi:hypothetical protein